MAGRIVALHCIEYQFWTLWCRMFATSYSQHSTLYQHIKNAMKTASSAWQNQLKFYSIKQFGLSPVEKETLQMEVKKTELQNNHIFHRVFTSTNTHVLCLIKQINSRKAHTPTSKRCRICLALALTKQLNQTSVWGNDCRQINTFCHFLPFSAIFCRF